MPSSANVVDGFVVVVCTDRRAHTQYEVIGDGFVVVDCTDRRAHAQTKHLTSVEDAAIMITSGFDGSMSALAVSRSTGSRRCMQRLPSNKVRTYEGLSKSRRGEVEYPGSTNPGSQCNTQRQCAPHTVPQRPRPSLTRQLKGCSFVLPSALYSLP